MNSTEISTDELYVLSYYRACELAGSLLFGSLAMHTTIDAVRVPLTRHCLEEVQHAWLWTETIAKLGHTPCKITRTYQSEYGKEFGLPRNMLEIFCLTQVFESRTVAHFRRHLAMPDVHPVVAETLHQMIEDEAGHLNWIKEKLDEYTEEHDSHAVNSLMHKLEKIDELIYGRLMNHEIYVRYFGPIGKSSNF